MSRMPPLFRFPKNTFITAYPIITAQNICRIGFPTPGMAADISTCCAVIPMLSASVMPDNADPKELCSDTLREYKLTGRMENRLTAINPLT